MSDLNTLVHMPDGVVLTNATGINNVGQIIAVTTPVPEPETYALLLAGLGLIGGHGAPPRDCLNNPTGLLKTLLQAK
jgi:hypothetical protein